jgi:hypothetical protein
MISEDNKRLCPWCGLQADALYPVMTKEQGEVMMCEICKNIEKEKHGEISMR